MVIKKKLLFAKTMSQVNCDITMTSQRYRKKTTSLNRLGRKLVNVGKQVMLNKLVLTFKAIYEVTMTSQRYREKSTSLNRLGRRLGNVGQQVMLNKLAIPVKSCSLVQS